MSTHFEVRWEQSNGNYRAPRQRVQTFDTEAGAVAFRSGRTTHKIFKVTVEEVAVDTAEQEDEA